MNRFARLSPIFAALALAACSTVAPGAPPTATPSPSPTPSPSAPPVGLDGRQFIAKSVTDDGAPHALVPGTQITISFTDGNVSAQAGCNIMGGTYTIVDNRLVFQGGSMTEMGCDPARHAQDDWLFEFLGSRPVIFLDGNDLELAGDTTTIKLLDREVAEPDQELVGPTWVLSSIITGDAVSSVPQGVTGTIVFTAGGQVEIHPGCNMGGGDYAIDGDSLRFGDLMLTKMACAGAAGEVEQNVLLVLSADAVQYTIDASVLTLQAGDRGLQFTAQ